jgi:catechol 2,3-dioxygenase-like lactoylglutathione lyase family enzyme
MNFEFNGIDHVQLAAPAGCEQLARKFYGEWLGLKEIPKPEKLVSRGGVWFACGQQQIHIGVEEPFQPAKKAHPAFAIRQIEQLREHLIKLGAKVQDDHLIEHVIRFHVEDPFGNRLEFVERK